MTGDTAGAPEQLQEMKFQQAGNQETLLQANSVLCKLHELLRLQPLRQCRISLKASDPQSRNPETVEFQERASEPIVQVT